jgi:diketogulonate reductase-like aldo/keto reductase
MRATIINNIDELAKVKTKAVVFAFRPSLGDILAIIAKRIKVIQINPASEKSLAKAGLAYLTQNKVICLTGSIQGVRKDKQGNIINIEIPEEEVEEVLKI